MIVAMPFSRQPKARRLQRELEKTKRDLQQYTKHTTTGSNETTVQPMTDKPDRPTDVTDEPDRPTEVTDNPDRPTDVTNEPDRPTEVTDKTDRPTEVTDKTDRPTDVTNEPDRPTEVTNELDRPTEETKEPERPTEVNDEPTLEKPTPPPLTPHSEAQKLVTVLGVTPSQKRILQVLPLTLTLSQVAKAPRSVKRELCSPNYKPKAGRYKGCFTKLAKKVRISTADLFRSRKIKNQRQALSLATKKVIQAFMRRPDNGFELPSKKDNVRRETRYALADSLKHLHSKFIRERPSFAVSLSTFCRARPATVKLARFAQRQICLCKDHANFALMIDAAKVLPKSTTETINLSDEEIGTKLNNITTSHITYHKWETTQEEHKGKPVSRVNLIKRYLRDGTSSASYRKAFLPLGHTANV